MTPPKKTSRQLADEHWDYIETILIQQLKVTRKMFVDAFIHGFKHGRDK